MENQQQEQWKNLLDFPIYQISNFGNVRNTQTMKILKPNVNKNGYLQLKVYQNNQFKNKRIHQLVSQYFIPNPNNFKYVDHINGNKLDNRLENLRFCTQQQNCMNRKKEEKSQCQYKGIYYQKNAKKYLARIMKEGKRITLGYFDDQIDAAREYDKKAKELFGIYAKLNFPDQNQLQITDD